MNSAKADLPTVLMVDDDEKLLASVRRTLSGSFNFITHVDGELALEWLAKNRRQVSAIVADLVMPTIDGINFLKRAYRSAPEVPRLLLSGNVSSVSLREAINHAMVNRVLAKPISVAMLKEALERAIETPEQQGPTEKVTPGMVNAAIDRSDFRTLIQPRVRASDFKRIGGEVLCRMPILQKRFEMEEIISGCADQPVVNRLTSQLMAIMIDLAPIYKDTLGAGAKISMNLAPYSISNTEFVRMLLRFSEKMRGNGVAVEFEIPEGQINITDQNFVKNAEFLAARGIRLLIDGFGAGNASIQLLRHEFFGGIKLDRTLVSRMMNDFLDDSFVSWVVQVCRKLDYLVVAVGVEDQITALRLQEYGVSELQGYFFGLPQPLEGMEPKPNQISAEAGGAIQSSAGIFSPNHCSAGVS